MTQWHNVPELADVLGSHGDIEGVAGGTKTDPMVAVDDAITLGVLAVQAARGCSIGGPI